MTLHNLIENLPELQSVILNGIDDVDIDDYIKSLRVEIRATYYQAVETLFELIFSLEPRNGIIDNENVWYFLSTSNGRANYDIIKKIAGGDTSFLDREVVAGKDITVPFVRYLFFFGIADKSREEQIVTSLEPIRGMLEAMAKSLAIEKSTTRSNTL